MAYARVTGWNPPRFEQLEPRQLLAQVSWDGGGGDLAWHNPLNWSGDVLPGPEDDVFLNIAGSPTISITQDVHVRSISSVEAVHLSAGVVTVGTLWKQSAPLAISGGAIAGAGNLALGGSAVWTGGTVGGSGKFQVLPGAEVIIDGDVVLARELVNNGALIWNGGDIEAHGALIHNLTGRTFLIRSAGRLIEASGGGIIHNGGTLQLDGTPGQITEVQVALNNYAGRIPSQFPPPGGTMLAPGTVEVVRGTLSFTGSVLQKQGGILSGGHWFITTGEGELRLPGANISQVLSVFQTTSILLRGQNSSFPQLYGAAAIADLTLEGRAFPITVAAIFGRLVIDNPGTTTHAGVGLTVSRLEVRAGHLVAGDVTAFEIDIDEGAMFTVTGILAPGQSIGGPGLAITGGGVLRIAGEFTMSRGRLETATTIITPGGRLTRAADSWIFAHYVVSSRIINYGTIDWGGPDVWRIHSELVNRGTFNIRTSGFVETSAGITSGIAPAYFHNFGTVNVLDGAVVTFRAAGGGVHFINRGFVNVQNGRLNLFGGVTSGVPGTVMLVPTWNVAPGSELAIGGLNATIHGAIIDAPGLVRIGTRLTFHNGSIIGNGDTIIGPTGQLIIVNVDALPSRQNQMLRSLTINHGLIDVEGIAEIRGPLRNYGTLAIGGNLEADRLVPFESSILRFRSTGPGQIGGLSVVHGGYFRGTLAVDFAWQPPVGSMFTVYFAYIFNTPGPPFGAFDQVFATGLPPGRGVEFVTSTGQQGTGQGRITIT